MNLNWSAIILKDGTIIFGPFSEDHDFSQYGQDYEIIKN
jgi:hypothetical protein